MFENRIDLSAVQQAADRIRAQFAKVIVGQSDLIDMLLRALLCDGHVLLEGAPGVAKTLAAKLLAQCVSVNFSRIQLTPDLMPSDVIGTMVFNPKNTEFSFRAGPVFSNIVLVDEINRAPAKTQSALLEVMEERHVTVDGTTHKMSSPFFVIATQNPVEHEGTYRLPEAQLDRFLFKISVPYPKLEDEVKILAHNHERRGDQGLSGIEPVLNAEQLAAARVLVQTIHIEQKLIEYIAKLVNQTRNHASIYLPASPRASLGILHAAKATAALSGTDFVTPEHIKEVSYPVLRHRIQLTPEREMEGAATDDVIREIVEKTDVPR